jgi:hypothetical protein
MLDCLYTFVKNMRPTATYYGYLPPHGNTLAPHEEIGFAGDLTTRIAARPGRSRDFRKFEKHLQADALRIIMTPRPILQDLKTAEIKSLYLNNGVLGTLDPCWEVTSRALRGQ